MTVLSSYRSSGQLKSPVRESRASNGRSLSPARIRSRAVSLMPCISRGFAPARKTRWPSRIFTVEIEKGFWPAVSFFSRFGVSIFQVPFSKREKVNCGFFKLSVEISNCPLSRASRSRRACKVGIRATSAPLLLIFTSLTETEGGSKDTCRPRQLTCMPRLVLAIVSNRGLAELT